MAATAETRCSSLRAATWSHTGLHLLQRPQRRLPFPLLRHPQHPGPCRRWRNSGYGQGQGRRQCRAEGSSLGKGRRLDGILLRGCRGCCGSQTRLSPGRSGAASSTGRSDPGRGTPLCSVSSLKRRMETLGVNEM